MQNKPRLIAFYLPQYHPIPENNEWWGNGFTEWTNVAKAKPLFKGHYQPHLPADLGFYDLRIPEVRQTQAELAREHGIEGFCYWHYWFSGKRLLERPFDEVLESGKPDFPFCLGWANETWSGIWHGRPNEILMEQMYPGLEDHRLHFYNVLNAFRDQRYMLVDGKPIFIIYKPKQLPEPQKFIDYWQALAVESGLKGIYFLGISESDWDYQSCGFNGIIMDTFYINLHVLRSRNVQPERNLLRRIIRKFKRWKENILETGKGSLEVYPYVEFINAGLPPLDERLEQYPLIIPNWDNTPRSGEKGVVLHNSNPALFSKQLGEAFEQVKNRPVDKKVVFLKSWNEWAEGNYLEPDSVNGTGYLSAIKECLNANECE